MQCDQHPEKKARAVCIGCSKALCNNCITLFEGKIFVKYVNKNWSSYLTKIQIQMNQMELIKKLPIGQLSTGTTGKINKRRKIW